MVFTEQDLNIGINPFDILNEATYVDGDALISPFTVSMVENSDIGGVVVRFSDVESISESYGCDYIDAMIAIAEENNVDPNYMAVVVDEADIIADPYIITELANVVVNPQSPYSLAYQFCEACLDCFLESGGDEDYLELMLNEDEVVSPETGYLGSFNKKHAALAAGAMAAGAGLKYAMHNPEVRAKMGEIGEKIKTKISGNKSAQKIKMQTEIIVNKIIKKAQGKPKSWIGQKIASLRAIYENLQNELNVRRATGDANLLQVAISTVLNGIDFLMGKLENFAG